MGHRIWLLCLIAVLSGLFSGHVGPLCAHTTAQSVGAESQAAPEGDGESSAVPAPSTNPDKQPASTSLESARDAVRTFLVGMERKDYATAVTALDFSDIKPTPDPYEKVHYAEQLKACIDRLALVDFSQVAADKDGPDVTFPPGAKDSIIVVGRGADGKWRFTAGTLASINDLYQILKDKPPVGSAPEAIQPAPSGEQEPDGIENEPAKKESPKAAEARPAVVAVVPGAQKSARRVMRTLFDSLQKSTTYPLAVSLLDFTELEQENPDLGPYAKLEYARRLKAVIERLALVDYAAISDDPEGPAFQFPPEAAYQPITISRSESGVWRFSADTVSKIDALYKVYKDKPVLNLSESQKPWYDRELILGNEVWRILTLFIAIFAGLFFGTLSRIFFRSRAELHKRHDRALRAVISDTLARTVTSVLFLVGMRIGVKVLVLDHEVSAVASTTISIILVLVVGYISFKLVDVAVELLRDVAEKSGSTLNDMLVPIVSTSLRLTIIVLVILQITTLISDQPPSAVIAGLGAGGLAIGLAAQDTIKNFFGSIMVFVDRPFELGDRIVIDGHDGPVEGVGFRSTRIRTLDGHLVTVPNGKMADKTVHNIGKRPFIRRIVNIRIAYDTPPEKVRRALAILRELLDGHDGMKEERPPRIFLHDFLETAINIRAMYWFHPPSYWEYCAFGERLNLQIIERFRAEDIRFALPAQRLFVSGDPESPADQGPLETT